MNGRKAISEHITRERLSAIIRTTNAETARRAIHAAIEGGFRIVEFTLTTPRALEMIAELRNAKDVAVGAGTVLSVEQVREAHSAGAGFVVSPICDPVIVAEAARLDLACIPGASTPTEMENAHRLGADFVKLFPAPAGGVEFVKSVRGPLPHLRIYPTNGITLENFVEYLEAGCAGVGFTAWLFAAADLAAGNLQVITTKAQAVMRRFQEWSGAKSRL